MRISKIVLSIEEQEAKLREEGKTDEQIADEIGRREQATNEAQARYDKAPPKYFKPVPTE